MDNKIINGFGYFGEVTIKQVYKNVIVKSHTGHNRGTLNMFKFLCNCVAGNYSVKNIPYKLVLFNSTNELNTVASGVALKDGQATIVKNNNSTGFSAILHFKLNSSALSSDEIDTLGLFSADETNYDLDNNAMAIYQDSQLSFNKAIDYVYYIDWKISFTNILKQDEKREDEDESLLTTAE